MYVIILCIVNIEKALYFADMLINLYCIVLYEIYRDYRT